MANKVPFDLLRHFRTDLQLAGVSTNYALRKLIESEVHVTSHERKPRGTTAPPHVELFDAGRPERLLRRLRGGEGRFRLTALATSSACLALFAATGASASRAVLAAEPLVSPQYQAENADTEAEVGPNGPAADPSGGGVAGAAADTGGAAAGADPVVQGARALRPAGTWYRVRNWQYQFRATISSRSEENGAHTSPSDRLASHVGGSSAPLERHTLITLGIPRDIARDNVISGSVSERDARRLLQLGLLLGFAYVVFLFCWFWRTRDRPRGAGRVVRF